MAVADYFGLHCCRPAVFTQQVSSRVGDTDPCWYQAREPMLVITLLTRTGSCVLASAFLIHTPQKTLFYVVVVDLLLPLERRMTTM